MADFTQAERIDGIENAVIGLIRIVRDLDGAAVERRLRGVRLALQEAAAGRVELPADRAKGLDYERLLLEGALGRGGVDA